MSIELTVMSLDFDSDEPPNIKTYEKNEITLGRGPDNDVVLAGAEVSSSHAKITVETGIDGIGSVTVTDLGSANGTLVDNIPLNPNEPKTLKKNERILISGYLIKPVFKSNGQAAKSNAVNLNRTIVIDDSSPLINFQEEIQAAREEVKASSPEDSPVEKAVKAVEPVSDEPLEDLVEPAAPEPDPMADMSELVASAAIVSEPDVPSPDETIVVGGSEEASSLAALEEFLNESEEEAPEKSEAAANEPKEEQGEASLDVVAPETFDEPLVAGVAGEHAVLDLDFEIEAVSAVKGCILHKGNGLAGVEVTCDQGSSVLTDEDGNFEVGEYTEEEKFELTFNKEKFIIEGPATGIASNDSVIEFEAKELFTIQGVIKSKGVPLAGVTVDGGPLGEAVTDEDGKYVFENVPEGTKFSIKPKKAGYRVKK